MYNIVTTTQFDKDLKKMQKRGQKLPKLWNVVSLLSQKHPLPPKHRMHKLQGFAKDIYECHIEPDWLLIWKFDNKDIVLIRTGTHSDLF